jgi:hypothetical protein
MKSDEKIVQLFGRANYYNLQEIKMGNPH